MCPPNPATSKPFAARPCNFSATFENLTGVSETRHIYYLRHELMNLGIDFSVRDGLGKTGSPAGVRPYGL